MRGLIYARLLFLSLATLHPLPSTHSPLPDPYSALTRGVALALASPQIMLF